MELFSTIIGKGEPLLILHGLYGSSDNWLTIAKELSNDFCVHSIDLRNHGRSPHSPTHNYTVMAEDIKEYLDMHDIDKTFLLGHSMGGKVAMLFTLNYPERVKKLIVADIAPKNYPQNYDGHIQILGVMNGVDLSQMQTRKEVENALNEKLRDNRVTQLVLKNLYRKKEGGFDWRINIKVLQESIENISGGTEDWDNKQTKVPTLFMKGSNSEYLTIDDDFTINKYFENSEITAIPNAGHWLHAEQPELVVKTILYFIN